MSALFFEDVPLVSAGLFTGFDDDSFIGHHYGDLTASRVRCIKITPTLWLVGAHPWRAITNCFVGGSRTTGFNAVVQLDSDGVTRQYVQLTAPPSSEQFTVEVSGYGKVALSGKLLENPDEIIEDIASLCGKVVNFPFFRAACNAIDLRIGGSVDEQRSLRSYINEIIESCGALWLGDTAFFHPSPLGYARTVRQPDQIKQWINAHDVAGELVVYYAWNQAKKFNGGQLVMTAKGSQYTNQGVHYAKWLRKGKDVERLARQILGKRAGKFINVSAIVPGVVKSGDVVELRVNQYQGPMRVLSARPSEAETELTGEVILETHPHLQITRFTQERDAKRSERLDVVIYPDKHIDVNVFDSQNRPMVGIYVTLDNAVSKQTDQNGTAVFINVSAGQHTLRLSGPDVDSDDPFPLYIP